MFQLESSRKGENIVPVLFQHGNAHDYIRATHVPPSGQRAIFPDQCERARQFPTSRLTPFFEPDLGGRGTGVIRSGMRSATAFRTRIR
jgi:hypothetical protein